MNQNTDYFVDAVTEILELAQSNGATDEDFKILGIPDHETYIGELVSRGASVNISEDAGQKHYVLLSR